MRGRDEERFGERKLDDDSDGKEVTSPIYRTCSYMRHIVRACSAPPQVSDSQLTLFVCAVFLPAVAV